jgi:hypothetical protein
MINAFHREYSRSFFKKIHIFIIVNDRCVFEAGLMIMPVQSLFDMIDEIFRIYFIDVADLLHQIDDVGKRKAFCFYNLFMIKNS